MDQCSSLEQCASALDALRARMEAEHQAWVAAGCPWTEGRAWLDPENAKGKKFAVWTGEKFEPIEPLATR